MLNLSHKNLEVYKISLLFVKEVYRITKLFPKEEQFVLVTQLRRAAISVSSNLAEGSARFSAKEKKRFYEIARASLVEVDTQIEISFLLGYLKDVSADEFQKYQESVFRMLCKMITNLDNQIKSAPPSSH